MGSFAVQQIRIPGFGLNYVCFGIYNPCMILIDLVYYIYMCVCVSKVEVCGGS